MEKLRRNRDEVTEQEGRNAETVIHGANLELMLAPTNPVKGC